MEKSKINCEDWILIALINASERHGGDLGKLLFSIPGELNIDQNQFFEILSKMEKEGIIRRASSGSVNYCLSEKGIKDAIRLKRRLNFNDYYFLISKFPEIELKERIETLEAFSVSSFFLIITAYAITTIYKINANANIVFLMGLIYTIILILSIISFSTNFATLFLFRILSYKKNTLWIYKEWLWNNKDKIIFPLPASFILLILYTVYKMDLVSWQTILWSLIVIGVSIIVTKYNEIVSKLSGFIPKK